MSFRVPDSPGSTSSATLSSHRQLFYEVEEQFGPQQGAMAETEIGDETPVFGQIERGARRIGIEDRDPADAEAFRARRQP